jgi:hypothetical protein
MNHYVGIDVSLEASSVCVVESISNTPLPFGRGIAIDPSRYDHSQSMLTTIARQRKTVRDLPLDEVIELWSHC